MSHVLHKKKMLSLLGAGAFVVGPMQAAADVPTVDENWRYGVSLYLWAPGIKGSTASGSDIDVSFDTIIDNLNMVFMGSVEARKNRWSALADILYLNLGSNGGGEVPVTTPSGANLGLEVDVSVKNRAWILSLLGGYNVRQDEKLSLDIIAGLRYFEMKVDFGLSKRLGPLQRQIETAAGGIVWDGVVGVRGRANLEGSWYLPFHVDVGAGDSDLTWQIAGGVGYHFDWGDMGLVYRHMEWDFPSGSGLNDINVSGPQLTATFRF
jgi:hypothetical protein